MWIGLYVLQTLTGAVLMRRFWINDDKEGSGLYCIFLSGILFLNIFFLVVFIIGLIDTFVDFLAGKK